MTKSESDLLSPGRIVLLWRIIYLVNKFSNIKIQNLINLCENLGILGGTLPVKQAVRLGQQCNLIEINNGFVVLTDECVRYFIPLCHEENPNIGFLQALLYKVIINNKYSWLLFFDEDVEIFKVAIPQGWIDLLNSAGLFDFEEKSVKDWWKELIGTFQKYDQEKSMEIGEIGEVLTYEHEKERLIIDGFSSFHLFLKWVSKISDQYGYDLISIKGGLFGKTKDIKENIYIEVKSSILKNENSFSFYLSRNEWNTAEKYLDSYYIYCWVGIDLKSKKPKSGPFIIPIKRLTNLIPVDRSEKGFWTECKIEVDLKKYAIS